MQGLAQPETWSPSTAGTLALIRIVAASTSIDHAAVLAEEAVAQPLQHVDQRRVLRAARR